MTARIARASPEFSGPRRIRFLAALGFCATAAWAQTPPATEGPTFEVGGYRVEGGNPIGGRGPGGAGAFTGKAVGLDRLQSAAEALERALHEAGYGFYRVILPPQDSVKVVTLKILPFTVGR